MMQKINTLISNNRRFLPLSVTIMLFFVAYAAGASMYDGMRDPQVFLNLFRNSPFLLISAIGMTFVILSGGIDLSVSGVVALTTVASAALLREGWNPWAVILLMLAMGMALGATMGAFITYLKVQPFIATLAGMWFARGMCFFISNDVIPIDNRTYTILARTKILIPGLSDPVAQTGDYISILVVVMMVVFIAAIYIAHFTRFGRTVYAMGGNNGANEHSARLMGLPVNRTQMMVYILNGFCSALAGITLSITVSSGHGLYAQGFEMTVIAAVVIGGTMLTGGEGYVFGTVFGVLVTGVIQTLIQFNGKLSSWWTPIVVGLLTLVFIIVQSLLAAQNVRLLASKKAKQAAEAAGTPAGAGRQGQRKSMPRNQKIALFGGGAFVVIIAAVLAISGMQKTANGTGDSTPLPNCQLQPFRQDQAATLMQGGAILAYERNGGPNCIDELYAVYPDGRIVGDDGTSTIEKQLDSGDVDQLLSDIVARQWFTNEMYNTYHNPCGSCYVYHITVSYNGQEKTVKAVDGGTDAPADYWQVVSEINGVIPKFTAP
jgi:ribose/xylose/arabinose/galactoside ABC-type transport system permease subunit